MQIHNYIITLHQDLVNIGVLILSLTGVKFTMALQIKDEQKTKYKDHSSLLIKFGSHVIA